MIALVALLAIPLGYFVVSRLAANCAYAVAYLWAFTFQTLYLLLDSIGKPRDPAFAPGEFPWAYGLVTMGIFLAGFGFVVLGQVLRRRRQAPLGLDG